MAIGSDEAGHFRRIAALCAAGLVAAITVPVAASLGTSPRRAAAATLAPATPAQPLCGVASPAGGPAGTFETPATFTSSTSTSATSVYPSSSVQSFYLDPSNGDLYVETSSAIVVTSESGSVISTFGLPSATTSGAALSSGNANTSIVADLSGNVYFFMQQGYGYVLVSLSSSGAQRFDAPVPGVPNGLFAWHDSSGAWAAAIVSRNASSGASNLVAPSGGAASGTVPVPGVNDSEIAGPGPSGGLLYTDGSYVHALSASGVPITASASGLPEIGSSGSGYSTAGQTPGAPFSFAGLGGAVEVGSTLYVVDGGPSNYGHGIDVFSATGIYEGDASGSSLGLRGGSPIYDANGTLFFQSGSGISSISTTGIQALLVMPSAPTQNGFGDTLGLGAGLATSAVGGYFASGQSPLVTASFDPWWSSFPDPLALHYSVASASEVTANAWPAPSVVPLSWSGVASGSSLSFSLATPASPGTYLVNADLVDTSSGATIGSTCLTYSVGMAGDTLNLSTLAPSSNFGGPPPERGVQLASALGTGAMREQLSMASLLPSCNPSAPTASTCGPAGLTGYASIDPATEQAAAEARSLGVNFEVQFGEEKPVDQALVSSGYWQADVQAIVEHLHASAPDLTDVEAWNEPNTGPFSPSSYVSSVLAPFYNAVQAANSADGTNLQVIGGTVVGMDVSGWWNGIAAAHGFSYMNIAAIHPYTSYDRSFEEQGTVAGIEQLKSLMASYGVASMPIWVTELGWWSDGEAAFYDVGNWLPRAWMWLRSLGITSWNYFITEGQFNGFGTDYSLIDATNGDTFVKPGALGLMTVSNVLGKRPFLSQVNLGIPHAYGMLFGPAAGSSTTNDVLAVWTNDMAVEGQVSLTSGSGTVTIATTGALGQSGSLAVSAGSPAQIGLSGAPTYLTVPAGDQISVGPAEAFGANLALGSTGATASASSSQGNGNPASAVIAGTANATGPTGAWESTSSDASPWVQVTLPTASTVDRVIVSTSSIASVVPGLRDYSVEVDSPGGWSTVAQVTGQLFSRIKDLSFAPVTGVTAVKVLVSSVDFNAQLNGLAPNWWTSTFPDYAVVDSLEVYAPGSGTTPTTTTTMPGTTTTTTVPTATTTTPPTTTTSGTTTTTVPTATTTTTTPGTATTTPTSTVPTATTTTTTSGTTTTDPPTTTDAPTTTTTTTTPPTTTTTPLTTTTVATTAAPPPITTTTAPASNSDTTSSPSAQVSSSPTSSASPPATSSPTTTTGVVAGGTGAGAVVIRRTKTTKKIFPMPGPPTFGLRTGTTALTATGVRMVHLLLGRGVLRVEAMLKGRRGMPTGAVAIDLAGRRLTWCTVRRGVALCSVPMRAVFSALHMRRVPLAWHGRLELAVVYGGNRIYHRSARRITTPLIFRLHRG